MAASRVGTRWVCPTTRLPTRGPCAQVPSTFSLTLSWYHSGRPQLALYKAASHAGVIGHGKNGRDRLLLPRLLGASEDRQPETRDPALARWQPDRSVRRVLVRGQGDGNDLETSRLRPAPEGDLR